MDHLFQSLRINSFVPVLEAYRSAGVDLGNALDGGAGSGSTAEEMLPHLSSDAVVHAYEPFPGNHRFFVGRDSRIRLVKRALGSHSAQLRLAVPSVVGEDSEWGRLGREGYSSAGHLSDDGPASEHDVIVDCVRADEDLIGRGRVGFVKLDLQGGELEALKGLGRVLFRDVALAWIEYGPLMSSPDVYRYMLDHGFVVFDTEYMFRGVPGRAATEHFEIAEQGARLSSGSTIWYGFKRRPWVDYDRELAGFVEDLGLIQTDLCCVNTAYMDEFLAALRFLLPSSRPHPPIPTAAPSSIDVAERLARGARRKLSRAIGGARLAVHSRLSSSTRTPRS